MLISYIAKKQTSANILEYMLNQVLESCLFKVLIIEV